MPLQREDPRGPYHTALVIAFFAVLALLGGVGAENGWIIAASGLVLLLSAPVAVQRGIQLRREAARQRGALLAGMRSTRR